jgi:hypothetical protein
VNGLRAGINWKAATAATLLIALVTVGGASARTDESVLPDPARVSSAATKPRPATARQAIARVRSHPDTNREALRFAREIRWAAEWRRDRWWVIGLFESSWGVRFVVDATIWKDDVYTFINYGMRPSRAWVRAKAERWMLRTLYTRLTPATAIEIVRASDPYDEVAHVRLSEFTVLDAVARLAIDNSATQAWYFAFYAQRSDGTRQVLAVADADARPSREGEYVGSEYGFGANASLYERVPLNLVDWVRAVSRARGWQPSNLP